jgi:hypothetical protein
MFEEELLFEEGELPPMQDKNAVFCIGRMQPPTAGHYKIFDKMKKYIRNYPELKLTPVVVVIEGRKSSEDKQKNPLTSDDRIKYMKASGNCDGFKFFVATNAFTALGKIRDEGYEPIVLAAGSDRAEGYLKNLDKNFRTPKDKAIEHFVIPGLDRVTAAVTTKKAEKEQALNDAINRIKDHEHIEDDEVSGSLARKVAELGYVEEFTKIVGLDRKPALAKLLFDNIRKNMGVEE